MRLVMSRASACGLSTFAPLRGFSFNFSATTDAALRAAVPSLNDTSATQYPFYPCGGLVR